MTLESEFIKPPVFFGVAHKDTSQTRNAENERSSKTLELNRTETFHLLKLKNENNFEIT